MVVVSIIGVLAGIAVVQVKNMQRKARETALLKDLHDMREAIDNFYADKQRYPSDLNELVPKYLQRIPKDPITKAQDWDAVTEPPIPMRQRTTTLRQPGRSASRREEQHPGRRWTIMFP
jgi:general secretion pathway protein G